MAKEHPGPLDMNERAYMTMRKVTDKHDETISGDEEDRVVPGPGRVASGQKGAAIRNQNLTPEQRSEIAKRAAEARWKKSEDAKPTEDDQE